MFKTRSLLLILIALFFLQACSSAKYISQPATPDFRIDGQQSEWSGQFETPKGEHFALAVSNDKNYLYLAITSLSRDFERQIGMRGLTIWVDTKGRKREQLGISFQGKTPRNQRPGRNGNQQDMYASPGESRDMRMNRPTFTGDIELIVTEEKRKRLGPSDLLASAAAKDEIFFMEYQIPLALMGEDFAVENILGLGIVSEFDRDSMRSQGGHSGMSGGGGGMSGGGGGGGGGRKGGMSGGGRPGGQGQRPDQTDLDVWIKVQLSPPQ